MSKISTRTHTNVSLILKLNPGILCSQHRVADKEAEDELKGYVAIDFVRRKNAAHISTF